MRKSRYNKVVLLDDERESMIMKIAKKRNISLNELRELTKLADKVQEVAPFNAGMPKKRGKKIVVQQEYKREVYKITLPFPPSINKYYGKCWRGNVYIKPAGKAFREKTKIILSQIGMSNINTKERLKAVMVFHAPDKRRRDWDNLQKAVWDGLKKHIYEDDCQIDCVFVGRGEPDYHRPRVDLVIVTSEPKFVSIHDAEKILTYMENVNQVQLPT